MSIIIKECKECIKDFIKNNITNNIILCKKCIQKNIKKTKYATYSFTRKILYKNYPEHLENNLDDTYVYYNPYKLYSLVKRFRSKL